jgi:predicted CXXCH cytochrome family protein
MDCTTCHVPEHPDGVTGSPGGRFMLRGGVSGAAFCAQCHEPGGTSGSRFDHAGLLARAHLRSDPWGSPIGAEDTSSTGWDSGVGHIGDPHLDAESRNCLSCHDGSNPAAKALGKSHPIGVPYEFVGFGERSRNRRMRPVQSLDPRIRLFDGRVGCGSCHNPYSDQPNMLAVHNHRSALCKSCHNLR